ncbi:MAG: protein kinase [Nannocystaceae bacterium]|nr:protein kinase [Nannocystaceae bacterium]
MSHPTTQWDSTSTRPGLSPMPTPLPSPISLLGRYTILGRIAAGGMASVYLARLADAPAGFSREFALKVIHPHLVREDGFTARFLQEAQLASRVRHPNVVRTVDAGEDQGYAFMALELIDGVNLRQLALHRARPFSAPHAAAIVEMVARGLDAVHEATDAEGDPLGMVHRDISPHNVMLARSGRAVLIDLGLARPDRTTGLTQVGVLAGKLPYMSPEQARLDDLDGRSDIFSMGTLLFELVTGELPFGDTHSAPTMTKLDACEPGPIREMLEAHAVPQWITDIVLACLRPTPEERISTAAGLADAIAQELSAAGHDTATQRGVLATIVEDAYETLGTVESAEPLPRIITASPPALAPAALPARALVWMAAAAGLVTVIGLGAWTLVEARPSTSTRVAPQAAGARSMSEDQAPAREPEPVQAREHPRSEPASSPLVEAETPQPERAPKHPRAPRRARPRPDPDGLKPNPYEKP